MIVRAWNRDYSLSPQYVAKAQDAILNAITSGRATDPERNPIEGESLSHVVAQVRMAHLKFPGAWADQKAILNALGFKIIKGRVLQSAKGGMRPGRVCDIVTLA